jgi:hypothetical protein
VDDIISIVPIAPFVAAANKPPKPTAGAKQAKKRNRIAAKDCAVSKSKGIRNNNFAKQWYCNEVNQLCAPEY